MVRHFHLIKNIAVIGISLIYHVSFDISWKVSYPFKFRGWIYTHIRNALIKICNGGIRNISCCLPARIHCRVGIGYTMSLMDHSLIKGDIRLIHHDRTELTLFVLAMTLLKQIVINNAPCMVLKTITKHLILGSRDWIISSKYPRRKCTLGNNRSSSWHIMTSSKMDWLLHN